MTMSMTAKPYLRILYVVWAFMECLLFGGLLYGWGSLVFVLKDEGLYGYVCHNDDNETWVNYISSNPNITSSPTFKIVVSMDVVHTTENSTKQHAVKKGCKEQDSVLTLVFTVASSLFCVGCAIMGHINYKFGTRTTRICSMITFVTGCLLIASVTTDIPWLIYPGMTLLGIGGIPLLVTNTQISNLFVSGSSTVVGLLCGAFDSSAAVQLIVKLAYEKGFSRQNSYFLIAGLHSLVIVSTFFFLPKGFIQKNKHEKIAEVTFKVDEDDVESTIKLDEEYEVTNAGDSIMPRKEIEVVRNETFTSGKPTLKSCLLSPTFILHVFWLSVLQLRFYFYLGSLNPWLNLILNGDTMQVSFFTNISLYFMLGGLVTSPLAGIVYDWQKSLFIDKRSKKCQHLMPSVFPLSFTVFMAILLSVFVLIPVVELLYLTFIILTVFRSFLYAMAAAFISALFPSDYFGLMYGILIIFGGIFSFTQYALFQWAEVASFDQVNIFLLMLVCTSFVHPAYQWYTAQQIETFTLKEEAKKRAH